MALSNKVPKRKAHLLVIKDDLLAFLADAQLGLFSLVEPASIPKRSNVDTAKEGGEYSPVLVAKASKTPCPS